MPQYQSYLKDCDCKRDGIILHEGKAVCRWCRKPYEKGGCLFYESEQFEKEKDIPKEWEITSYLAVPDVIKSVERLTDNILFTIGDEVYIKKNTGGDTKFTISKFEVEPHNNLMVTAKGTMCRWNITLLQKVNPKEDVLNKDDVLKVIQTLQKFL